MHNAKNKTSTKLLVIVITTTAIIAAATTTSIGAARPAFAKQNCTETPEGGSFCSGGSNRQCTGCSGGSGGFGSHSTFDLASGEVVASGGGGHHSICILLPSPVKLWVLENMASIQNN